MKKIHDFDLVFDSQRYYRLVLHGCANPGTAMEVQDFAGKMYGCQAGMLAFAMTFLDNEVSFWADEETVAKQITALTLSHERGVSEADFLFVTDPSPVRLKEVIEQAKCGTLRDPHKSAMVIIRSEGEFAAELSLSGPGIREQLDIRVPETMKRAFELREAQGYEYPEGIDFVFLLEDGTLMAFPRLVRIRQEEQAQNIRKEVG